MRFLFKCIMVSFIMAIRCLSAKTEFSTTISTGNSTGLTILTAILMNMDGIWLSSLQIMPRRNLQKSRISSITLLRKGLFSSSTIKIPNTNNQISDLSLLMRTTIIQAASDRIIKNKVMLYYEGDHEAFERQIAASITEVIINEMLYNADVKDRIASSSMINMPDWYIKGLIGYVGGGWDYEAENRVKDGFKSGKFKKINHLEYDDAIDAGESFWRFIGKKYGDALIPQYNLPYENL